MPDTLSFQSQVDLVKCIFEPQWCVSHASAQPFVLVFHTRDFKDTDVAFGLRLKATLTEFGTEIRRVMRELRAYED